MPKTRKRPIFGNAADPTGVTDLDNARLIDITLLAPNPFQPRSTFDPVALDELAASIREHGVLQALSVRETPGESDAYQLIAGERRKRAAEIAGLDAVPCLVQDVDDRAMALFALTENVQREDLSPLDLAFFCDRLRSITGLSARALSDQLGKNHNYVDDLLKLIRYPRVADLLRAGAITNPTVAAAIADIDDTARRTEVLDRAERGERLRVRDIQEARDRPATRADSVPDRPPQRVATGRSTAPDNLAGVGRSPTSESRDEAGSRRVVPAPTMPLSSDDAVVHLHDLRIIQLREGRDGKPHHLDTADKATVLRVLRADLAWLEDSDRHATGEASAHD